MLTITATSVLSSAMTAAAPVAATSPTTDRSVQRRSRNSCLVMRSEVGENVRRRWSLFGFPRAIVFCHTVSMACEQLRLAGLGGLPLGLAGRRRVGLRYRALGHPRGAHRYEQDEMSDR